MKGRTIIAAVAAIAVAAIVGALYLVIGGGGETRRGATLTRSYSSGKTLLTLNGVSAGPVKSVDCGEVNADLTRQEVVTKWPDPKQIGAARYEPCTISFGLSMEPALYSWINEAMSGKVGARTVSLQSLDYDNKEVSRLDLGQAMLTEFSMPDLDSASNDYGYMTITVTPGSVLAKAGSGAVITVPTTKQKAWVSAAFRFDLGLSKLTAAKVSGIGFKVDPGTQRPLFDNFTVTVPESAVGDPAKFLSSFVVEGRNTPENETTAKLTVLDSTLTNTLATLSFGGVGMSGGDLVGLTEGSETVAKRRYTLYVEGANLAVAP